MLHTLSCLCSDCLALSPCYSNYTQKKPWSPATTQKKERWVIVVLLLVIVGLIAALIITNTKDLTDDVTISKNQNSAPCDDDWIWYRGKCYYFSTERATWENSLEYCREQNASLALIYNQEEYEFLFQFKGSDNHWIGLRRTDNNGDWTWSNGTIYKGSLFTIKRSSSPESTEYVFLNHDGVRSQEGYFDYKWICSKKTKTR
ncbi:C-type lectin domain family 2 member A-like [Leptodactylus fuscus]|uniref:C-type lectin domain family 2 member A-like n=1 Tax=Leptodactylus fuscus TaxID=238119 RepID=UPI003F4E82BB